MEKISRQRNV